MESFHASPTKDLTKLRAGAGENSGNILTGIHSTVSASEARGFGDNVYRLAVEEGTVFDLTNARDAKKMPIKQPMRDKFVGFLSRGIVSTEAEMDAKLRSGEADYSHLTYVAGKLNYWIKSGGHPPSVTPDQKRDIFIAGGYDTLVERMFGAKRLISLHPDSVRIIGNV